MPFYNCQGEIPSKRHTVFKKNKKLLFEQHISREGFSGIYSNMYHLSMPTKLKKVGDLVNINLIAGKAKHQPQHLETFNINQNGDMLKSKIPLLFNDDIIISISTVSENMNYFYRNGHFDEILYIQYGKGVIMSSFGDLEYKEGDYIVIPRGVVWKAKLGKKTKLLVVESKSAIETPKKYRNRFGQLLESSPYCERDIKVPVLNTPINKKSDCLVKVRLINGIQEYVYDHHPFDVVGWDGYYYPWIFNINDFEPIVGSIHQPPSVHQTFQGNNFVVCSFVSRLFDFHKDAIPSPYPHSNVDSDEFIFYSHGSFMSREGIKKESATLHPMGLPHGPQPGKYELSIGKKKTEELAVMIDTFNPLYLTEEALKISDNNYALSWIK